MRALIDVRSGAASRLLSSTDSFSSMSIKLLDLNRSASMSHWFKDNSLSIGRTPLVRLNRITDGARRRPCWPRSRAATPPIPSNAASARR